MGTQKQGGQVVFEDGSNLFRPTHANGRIKEEVFRGLLPNKLII